MMLEQDLNHLFPFQLLLHSALNEEPMVLTVHAESPGLGAGTVIPGLA